MKWLVGLLFIMCGVFLAFYFGIWVFAIDGIENMADGAKADPTDGGQIFWGVIQFFVLSWVVGGIGFWIPAILGIWLMTGDFRPTGRKPRFDPVSRTWQ